MLMADEYSDNQRRRPKIRPGESHRGVDQDPIESYRPYPSLIDLSYCPTSFYLLFPLDRGFLLRAPYDEDIPQYGEIKETCIYHSLAVIMVPRGSIVNDPAPGAGHKSRCCA